MKLLSTLIHGRVSFRLVAGMFIVAATAAPLFHALHAGNVWEDFLITFSFSENLCEGRGLTHGIGARRVHGFTSPLGVLLPAICHLISGQRSHLAALWTFRLLFCLPAFVTGGLLLTRLFASDDGRRVGAAGIAVAALYILETKSIVFSMNGMETALMLLFLAWAVFLSWRNLEDRWFSLGLAWGGLMWTRPDACVFIAALAVATIAFPETDRKTVFVAMLKAAVVTTVVYAPWFLWTWWYYGSPVPHTILAKRHLIPSLGLGERLLAALAAFPRRLGWIFGPIYPHFGGWPVVTTVVATAMGFVAVFHWITPVRDFRGRRISLAAFLIAGYFAFMPFPYPWYFPPLATLGLVVIVRATLTFGEWRKLEGREWLILIPVLLFSVLTLSATSRQLRVQQRLVEDGVRRQVGEWLNVNAAPDDRIYVECLGYIGYFADREMLDYPGLATPEVERLLANGKNFVTAAAACEPDWMALRPWEAQAMARPPNPLRNYRLAKVFTAVERVQEANWIPGRNYLLYDATFLVFERQRPHPPETLNRKQRPVRPRGARFH